MARTTRIKVGDWIVSPERNLLACGARSVKIEPQAMDVLVYLADHAGEVISVDEIIKAAWHGRVIDQTGVYNRIKKLRAAFGDNARTPRYIETIPRRGYRLVAPVEPVPSAEIGRSVTTLRGIIRANPLRAAFVAAASAAAVALYLASPSGPPQIDGLAAPTIVAVLPFADRTPSEEGFYLGEGIAEELIHALSSEPRLKVIAPASAFSFANSGARIEEISERLGAAAIVDGEVDFDGERLRIAAILYDGESGSEIWSQSFEGQLPALVTVERAMASGIVHELLGADVDTSGVAAALAPIGNIDAYEYYLLGRERMRSSTGLARSWPATDASRAIEYFRSAIELEPDFARAYSGLADAVLLSAVIGGGFESPAELDEHLRQEAEEAIQTALALDPTLAEAYASLGLAHRVLYGDHERARQAYRRAIELNPNLAIPRYWLGRSLNGEEAIVLLESARELEPMSIEINMWLGRKYRELGRYGAAAEYFRNAVELGDATILAYLETATNARSLGRPDEAVRVLQPLLERADLSAERGVILSTMARLYLDLNDTQRASALLTSIGTGFDPVAAKIQSALASARFDIAETLTHSWTERNSNRPLYEMLLGHDEHSLAGYETLTAELENELPSDYRWGYSGAVYAAHLYTKKGAEDAAERLLSDERTELRTMIDADPYVRGGAYYLLASIDAIEGDKNSALEMLERAVENGWTRHWYAPIDPNLASLRDEPRFRELIAGVRAQMDALRADLNPVVAFAEE